MGFNCFVIYHEYIPHRCSWGYSLIKASKWVNQDNCWLILSLKLSWDTSWHVSEINEKLANFANENLNEEIEFLGDNSKTNKETKMIEKISFAGRVVGSKMSENLDDEIENDSNKTEGNEIVFKC